jgi:hypothetical protein
MVHAHHTHRIQIAGWRPFGILLLSPDAGPPGSDALTALGMRDAVLDIAVTPDRIAIVRGLAQHRGAQPERWSAGSIRPVGYPGR